MDVFNIKCENLRYTAGDVVRGVIIVQHSGDNKPCGGFEVTLKGLESSVLHVHARDDDDIPVYGTNNVLSLVKVISLDQITVCQVRYSAKGFIINE